MTPQLSTRAINYGVELEFVFAFHEKELSLGQTNGVPNTLKKDLSYYAREEHPRFTKISPVELPNHVYNSWAIVEGGDENKTRPYLSEPQFIIQRKFAAKLSDMPTIVRGALTRETKSLASLENYSKWIITSDHTVCGRGSPNIQSWLPDHEIDAKEWDSYGIEITSRILNSDSPADSEEIASITNALQGVTYGAFITNQCGLHVHVEAPQDFAVLKELALLCVVYEDQISRLHPPCRRPRHETTRRTIDSNRLAFIAHEDPYADPKALHRLDCSYKAMEEKGWTTRRIRDRIDDCQNKEELAQLMCWRPGTHEGDKNRIVNFMYLIPGAGYAQTIEFRQARGSLEQDEICRWVDFCIALVRLAEHYAFHKEENLVLDFGKEGRGDIFGLLGKLGLGKEAVEFWREKIERYEDCVKGGVDDRTDNEMPPEDEPFEDGEEGED